MRTAIKDRDKTYARAKGTKNEQDWAQLKIARNKVVKIIKKEKKEYLENTIDKNKKEPKIMWKVLKNIIRGENKRTQTIYNIDFEILDSDMKGSIADKFNIYYLKNIEDN